MRLRTMFLGLMVCAMVMVCAGGRLLAQAPAPSPIAIAPLEGVQLTGALQVADGKANILNSGSITAGEHSAKIVLPHRGELRVCPTTKVSLTTDRSVAAHLEPGEEPGLMMAMDHGAIEANFATGKNSDVILTPDFRIVISGPGAAAVQVRLGDKGDTCVDNRGPDAPYVTVSNIFNGGVYRVQPDQRVLFEQGSLNAVVDKEKESCGCPPEAPAKKSVSDNDFPIAQSVGMSPLAPTPPNQTAPGVVGAQATVQLSYDGEKAAKGEAPGTATAATPQTLAPQPVAPAKVDAKRNSKQATRSSFMRKFGHFFRNLFGG